MVEAVKLISIVARSVFHPVSAYEFEFLKAEEVVRQRLGAATVYVIGQRPLTYIKNVRPHRGELFFDIVDRTNAEPLACRFSPQQAGLVDRGSTFDIELQFYTDTPTPPPYDHVAGVKIFDGVGDFKYWMGPQKFIAGFLNGSPGGWVLSGDPTAFVDFHVHYIGKAFDQKVWERLTGHHKLQKIVTVQPSMSDAARMNSFELTVLMLEIVGCDEVPMIGDWRPYAKLAPQDLPILTNLSASEADSFLAPSISPGAPQLTTEVEAMLVHLFKPAYNDVKYENYPDIASGTRSLGYSKSELAFERLSFGLRTGAHAIHPQLPKSDWRVRRWLYGACQSWSCSDLIERGIAVDK